MFCTCLPVRKKERRNRVEREQHRRAKAEGKAVWYPILFAALIALIAFLSFYKLDVKYVDPWDEARHGVNAYEMANGGSLFQNTYLRQADYYNLKPPLSMWCIMLFMGIFGNTVFALRFGSALCYVLLAVSAGLFVRRYGKLESLLAVAFLAANTTAFQAHMIRAGDADSLYVLLFTLAMFAMMRIPEHPNNLYVCGVLFALAFLTKSFHAGVIALIGGLYLILTGQIKQIRVKHWILFFLSVTVPILLWAVPRYLIDNMTFFRKMWETDVLGRTDGTLHSNPAPFSYYLSYYFGAASGKVTVYLCAFVLILLAAVVFSHFFAWKNKTAYIGWLLWAVVPLLAFSAVSNKLLWYVYPSLVPVLLAAGIGAARLIKEKRILPFFRVMVAVATAVILVFYVHGIVETINRQGTNDFQMLVRQVAEDDTYDGCQVFVEYALNEDGTVQSVWNQQDVFVAEAYGDYECMQNGLLSVMTRSTYSGKTGILFVGDDVYNASVDVYEAYETIAQNGGYRALLVSY